MKKFFLWVLTFGWAYLIFYLTSIPNLKVTDNSMLGVILMNGAHFCFFGVLAVLLYFDLPKKVSGLSRMHAAIIVTSLYGILDELHQLSIAGRMADPIDWVVDTLGAIIFLAILTKIVRKKV